MFVTKHFTNVTQILTDIIFAGRWWDLQPPDPWVLSINSIPKKSFSILCFTLHYDLQECHPQCYIRPYCIVKTPDLTGSPYHISTLLWKGKPLSMMPMPSDGCTVFQHGDFWFRIFLCRYMSSDGLIPHLMSLAMFL